MGPPRYLVGNPTSASPPHRVLATWRAPGWTSAWRPQVTDRSRGVVHLKYVETHGPAASTTRKHDPARKTPSCLDLLFLLHAWQAS